MNELRAAIPAKEVEIGIASARRRLEAGIAAMNQVLKSDLSDEERLELARTVTFGLVNLNLLSIALQ